MSKTYTQTKAQALLLANDANFDSTQADSILDEMYQRYWKTFLKDRVKIVDAFVTFSQSDYVKTVTTSGVREILNLLQIATASASSTLGIPRAGMTRDDFEAVCADAESLGADGFPIRWGAYKLQGSDNWRVAVFPASAGIIVFSAEVLPTYTTPSGSTAMEGDDVDALNVARLAAVEIMVRNGDDPNDIQQVWAPLEQAVKEKFQYVMERGRPNEHPQKEQV